MAKGAPVIAGAAIDKMTIGADDIVTIAGHDGGARSIRIVAGGSIVALE
jgi:hypothetical protein